MLAEVKTVLSLEVNIMEFGKWFEVEAREGKWSDNSEVLNVDEQEIKIPETEDNKDHHIWKKFSYDKVIHENSKKKKSNPVLIKKPENLPFCPSSFPESIGKFC